MKSNTCCFIAWILSIHAIACLLFTSGFFLTRVEIDVKSTCNDINNGNLDSRLQNSNTSNSTDECWTSQSYDKVVFLMVDALRYDFVAPTKNARKVEWQNRLKSLQTSLENKPEQSRLFLFKADAPTTTAQRLKGLTTGSLPTFIDIGKNFGSSSIHEDNFISQLVDSGRRIVFMGDDTWENLYPGKFSISHPYPSFNVKDLHTVDNGVIEHLFPLLEDSNQHNSWDMLIGHFLGVDHVGHRYGPNNEIMKQKLLQMDEVFERVIHTIDGDQSNKDILLIICGDHGMTSDGDHGGASSDETSAAMFMYSNKPFPSPVSLEYGHYDINQVDIVPTLSLLFGLPIPFSNIGKIIPDVFRDAELNLALSINAAQIERYLKHYFQAMFYKKSKDELEKLQQLFESSFNDTHLAEEIVSKSFQTYLDEAGLFCRRMWTTFDTLSMGIGVALFFISSICIILALLSKSQDKQCLELPLLTMVLSSICVSFICAILSDYNSIQCLGCAALSSCAVFAAKQCMLSWDFYFRCFGVDSMFICLFMIVHACGLTSNSFIVSEEKVILYLLVSSLFVYFYKAMQNKVPSHVYVALSLALFGTRALSECSITFKDSNNNITLVNTLIPLISIPMIFSRLISKCNNTSGRPIPVAKVIANILWLSHIIILVYWSCIHVNMMDRLPKIIRIGMPRAVFLLSFISLCITAISPFSAYVNLKASNAAKSGITTALPVSSLVLMMSLEPTILLVLGPASSLLISIAIITAFAFLYANHVICEVSYSKLKLSQFSMGADKASHERRMRRVLNSGGFNAAIVLSMLTHLLFFTSGHHNDFSKLQHNAGFVGVEDFSLIISGGLVFLNTAASHLLLICLVPLISLSTTDIGKKLIGIHYDKRGLATASSSNLISIEVAILGVILYPSFNAFVTSAFVYSARRHLMVWAIFAPKYIFDIGHLLLIDTIVLVVYGVLARVLSGVNVTTKPAEMKK